MSTFEHKMKDKRWNKWLLTLAGWSDKTSSPGKFLANKSIFFRPHSKKSIFWRIRATGQNVLIILLLNNSPISVLHAFEEWMQNNVVVPIWFHRPSGRMSTTSVSSWVSEIRHPPCSIIHTFLLVRRKDFISHVYCVYISIRAIHLVSYLSWEEIICAHRTKSALQKRSAMLWSARNILFSDE